MSGWLPSSSLLEAGQGPVEGRPSVPRTSSFTTEVDRAHIAATVGDGAVRQRLALSSEGLGVNCMTQTEAVALQLIGVATMVGAAVDKLQAFVSPEAWAAKKVKAWEEDAVFMSSIGLDPVAVLGPAPNPVRAGRPLPVRLPQLQPAL